MRGVPRETACYLPMQNSLNSRSSTSSTSSRPVRRPVGNARSVKNVATASGQSTELDLDETVDETCRNAGELEIVFRPPRRNRAVRVHQAGEDHEVAASGPDQLLERAHLAAKGCGRLQVVAWVPARAQSVQRHGHRLQPPFGQALLGVTGLVRECCDRLPAEVGERLAAGPGEPRYGALVASTMLVTTLSLFHLAAGLLAREQRNTIFDRDAVPGPTQLRRYGIALLAIVVLYPLSLGPTCWISSLAGAGGPSDPQRSPAAFFCGPPCRSGKTNRPSLTFMRLRIM